MYRFLVIASFLCAAVKGSYISKIGIGYKSFHVAPNPVRAWELGDVLCVMKDTQKMLCGTITKVLPHEAVAKIHYRGMEASEPIVKKSKRGEFIHMSFQRSPIRIGAPVKMVSSGPARAPASITTEKKPEVDPNEELRYRLGLPPGVGIYDVYPLNSATVGMDFVFPTLHLQQALSYHIAVGLELSHFTYPAGNGQISGWGGHFTLNYYDKAPFTGLWLRFAIGAYDLAAEVGTSMEPVLGFTGILDLGWKWRWRSGLSFGLGVGIRGLITTPTRTVSIQPPVVLPSLTMDIGLTF